MPLASTAMKSVVCWGVWSAPVLWSREYAHFFQKVSCSLDSLSIRVVQLVNVEPAEIAEHTMHPVALDLLIHRKRLTTRRRRKTPYETVVATSARRTALAPGGHSHTRRPASCPGCGMPRRSAVVLQSQNIGRTSVGS